MAKPDPALTRPGLRYTWKRLAAVAPTRTSLSTPIMAKPKPKSRDKFTLVTTGLVILLLVASFAAVWFYRQNQLKTDLRQNYTLVGRMVVSTDEYSVGTDMALETSAENAEWASRNQPAIRAAIETTLRSLDAQQVRLPGGLAALQVALTAAVNKSMKTDKVEQILLTDFLLQTGV
ncbi:MAG: flagellar basal body-associated protein FliL [Burkholderiaceae bacterium]|jgi:flagellar basal body-associated protein FliL